MQSRWKKWSSLRSEKMNPMPFRFINEIAYVKAFMIYDWYLQSIHIYFIIKLNNMFLTQ